VNEASRLLGGTTTIVPTDGFTGTLLAVVVFLAMLVIELSLHFRTLADNLRDELPTKVSKELRHDLDIAVERSFAKSAMGALTSDSTAVTAVARFLAQYFGALCRRGGGGRISRIPSTTRETPLIVPIDQFRRLNYQRHP
jgi:hypothetical protein